MRPGFEPKARPDTGPISGFKLALMAEFLFSPDDVRRQCVAEIRSGFEFWILRPDCGHGASRSRPFASLVSNIALYANRRRCRSCSNT